MKKLFTILAVAIGFILCGCTKADMDEPTSFRFANESDRFVGIPSTGGKVVIDFYSPYDWTTLVEYDWIRVSPNSGGAGNTSIILAAEPISDGRARSSLVTIKLDNGETYDVTVSQYLVDDGKKSGFYLGILGFNSQVYRLNLRHLSNESIGRYNSFIDNLSTDDGTLLYYAVEKSINHLQDNIYPSNLFNVSIVTFTDGIDQGSLNISNEYISNSEYLQALSTRLNYETVSGKNIDAYSIGVLGVDARNNYTLFRNNLEGLATSNDNVFEVTNMSEVESKFSEIASHLGETNTFYNIALKITGPSDMEKCRFTFDNVSNGNVFRQYIEGTFRRYKDTSGIRVALEDVKYVGITSTSGTTINGVKSGIFFEFTFENLQLLNGAPINKENIKYWFTEGGNWVTSSETNQFSIPTLEKIKRTAVIMLNLDCSSSLGSDFSVMQRCAKSFIAKLLEYATDPNEVASVSLDKTSVTLGVGNTTTLKATVLPTTASQKNVVWSSSNTQVASVNQSGVVTANAEGTATITVTTVDGGYTATCKVTVVKTPQSYTENASCSLNMKMVYVEGGTFTMGATSEQGSDADSNEKPTHSVTLSSYYIAECEVTQAQWKAIMGNNPSSFTGDTNRPVETVSWEDAQDFCTKLSQKTGKTYVLPTEAQWEYAARGGNKSKGYKYSGSNTIGNVAWYTSNSSSATHPVKQKSANELGLYDMSGNVWEWCSDRYGDYSSSAQTNPTGPSSGSYRVLRGGSWYGNAGGCRVSGRGYNTPSIRYDFNGFRVVCLP